jgi:hypothetical protein
VDRTQMIKDLRHGFDEMQRLSEEAEKDS